MTTTNRISRHSPSLLPRGRRNGWVFLDPAWAKALGVHRDRGEYRIRHRELLCRLRPAPEPLAVPGVWRIDPSESRIALVSPEAPGATTFGPVSGTVSTSRGAAGSWVELSAGHAGRRSHPPVRFRSSSMEVWGPRRARVKGDLTFGGVTRPASLDLSYLGPAYGGPGSDQVALAGSTLIDTGAFGLTRRSGDGQVVELRIDARAAAA